MSESPRVESPLNEVVLPDDAEAGVRFEEIPFTGLINLRGRPDDAVFMGAVAGVLGCAPPTAPNTCVHAGDLTIFWLGPDEWLLMTPPERQRERITALENALAGLFCSVVDVTGYYTTIAIGGAHAAELLAKGSMLDLHLPLFGPGRCAQTLVAKATVLLWPVDADPFAYRVLVRRSFADYFARWLIEAAREFYATEKAAAE